MKQDFDQYRYLNIPISSVHKTLRKTLRFYPYKIKLIHAMKAEDGPARKRFADTMLQNICQDDRYLQKICLKTRQPFKSLKLSTGIMSESGEPVIQESLLRKNETHPKSTSDAGCSTTESLDPFFREPTVTQNSYLEMLESFVYPQLQGVQDVIFSRMVLSLIWTFGVRESLNQQFPGKRIGRGGPITWPARCPDVTPIDFFFWGYVKDCVFRNPLKNIEDLKDRITEVITLFNTDMLADTWVELRRR